MYEQISEALNAIHPALLPTAGVALLLLVGAIVDVIAKSLLVRGARGIARATATRWDDFLIEHRFFARIAHVLPAGVVYVGVSLVPGLPELAATILTNVSAAYAVIALVMAVSALLSTANSIYELRPEAVRRPIKGYVQVAKIVLYCLGAILVVSALINKSPVILLSGFGALTAVLLLVFRDTILSLVASIQLSGNDMVRRGDWIEMPQYNADGDVIDVALHTIRVQNWDKTITTIPTHKLIADSFRNWRGMSESGGRRIKRSITIDMQSVRFLTPDEIEHFRRFALLRDYIDRKREELERYNAALELPVDDEVNLRRLTNLGTFRAYVANYLDHHPSIRKDMTLLVRQLAPAADGIPIELYCFTSTTAWGDYEAIQGDLFDHLLAILDEFGLKAYQQPSGTDLADWMQRFDPATEDAGRA
ncbi:MAG: mechanosensitive ion channel domain-containing protein [Pseudomonadota bacterium]